MYPRHGFPLLGFRGPRFAYYAPVEIPERSALAKESPKLIA